ncbi:hypothetical protein ACLOJK_034444, partial [Asimina triloba]
MAHRSSQQNRPIQAAPANILVVSNPRSSRGLANHQPTATIMKASRQHVKRSRKDITSTMGEVASDLGQQKRHEQGRAGRELREKLSG